MTTVVAPSRRYQMLPALFALEIIAINLVRIPESMRFDRFAFCDQGANLTLQYLVANGMRPSLDFGYHYGLLPALFGRVWFAIFAATPWSYQLAMMAADILCAWAIAQILYELRIGAVGLALTIITLGYAIQASYINLAHAIEAVLILHALANQIRGSRATALALCAAAVFAKPSMGYIYGLLLVALLVRDAMRDEAPLRRIALGLAPAAAVFAGMCALMAYLYSPATLLHTIVPIEGATNYHALNFGLMKAGKDLWDPHDRPWIFYLIDVSGFWIVSTLFIVGAAAVALSSGPNISSRHKETILTCATLHLAFLTLFFGNQWSWIYYPYLLTIGSATAIGVGPAARRIGVALCVIALLSWTDRVYWMHRWWQTTAPDAATAGLWAPADERSEWRQVRALSHASNTVMLDSMGATELLFSGFENPVSLYLTGGLMQPSDVRRKLDELAGSQVAIVPLTIEACSGVPDAPEFRAALKSFDLAWEGKHFEVYRRRATP